MPQVVSSLVPQNRLSATNELWLAIGLPMRDRAGLENFVTDVSDPHSLNFRHFLTREEVTARFGPTEQDYEAVKKFAVTNGLAIKVTHANRLVLDAAGQPAAVEKAFHIKLQTYRHPTEARDFYAPDSEPMVDVTLPVTDVEGLTDYWLPHPKKTTSKKSHATPKRAANGSAPDGSGDLFGDDFRNAYVPGTTLTGAGQSVGLVEFDGYLASDVFDYADQAGDGRANIELVTALLDNFSGNPQTVGGEEEVEGDIEMVMAIAPGLAQIVTFEAKPTSPGSTS